MISKSPILTPSNEQNSIIESLLESNVVVNSVAGSGKTTTNMFIAKAYPQSNILLLTYNKKLSYETKSRIDEWGLSNISVYTYHSFCCSYYVDSCKNDTELENFITNPPDKLKKDFSYDIIILDEAQDITHLLYSLIWKIFSDNKKQKNNMKVCILGDIYQSIYEYNGADSRYIKLAKDIYQVNDLEWKYVTLSKSYRVTSQMCSFLNKVCLKGTRILSTRVGKWKPIYIIGDPFQVILVNIHNIIIDCLKNLGYVEDDIFVLAASMRCKNTSPLKQLANKLTSSRIPIYIPLSDEETVDTNSVRGKILFSSYHQAKGMERKVVIVLGFSNSYFEFYSKDLDPFKLSNPQYVALTRASELLVIQQDSTSECCKFVNKDIIKDYVVIQCGNVNDRGSIRCNEAESYKTVTNFVRNFKYGFFKKLEKYFTLEIISEKSDPIKFISSIKQNGLSESVSELNGIAIPTYYQYRKTGNMDILTDQLCDFITAQKKLRLETNKKFGNCKLDEYDFITSIKKNRTINIKDINIGELLYIVNHYNALRDNIICKVHQITSYNWVNKKVMDDSYNRIKRWITSDAIYEKRISCYLNKSYGLEGCIDIIDHENVWEIKCVKELDYTHYLQLITYICAINEFIIWKISVLTELIKNYDRRKNILVDYYRAYHKNYTYIEFIKGMQLNSNIRVEELQSYKEYEEKYFDTLSFKLFNVLTNEIVEICTTSKKAGIMFSMIKNYKDNSASKPDKVFLKKCEKYRSRFV